MKKTVSMITLSTLLLYSIPFTSASMDSSQNMMQENSMNMNSEIMQTMDMKNMNKMWKMMNSDMMQKMNIIMEKIGTKLDDIGKKQLKDMREEHMSDMMSFMKKFPDMKQSKEKMMAMQEMKKEHFSDLKKLLKDDPDFYTEVSGEMEKMMKRMMKKMHSWNGGAMSMMWEMKREVKATLSSENQERIDNLLSKLFQKVETLEDTKKTEVFDNILSKIETARVQYRGMKTQKKREELRAILDYLQDKISAKKTMGMWMIWMKGGFKNSVLMDSEENLMKAKKVEVVELSDGDVYTMEVTKVEKEIGNAKVIMLAYNGSIPGPVIKVKKDSQVTIKFINKVKGLETTLHSHGLRLDNKMDGVPDITQEVLKYGDSFSYKLDFVDEGVYWYHPHVREDLQQELWLYGNYIVDPVDTKYWSKVNREETIILDDILLEDGKIGGMSDQFANYVMMWRFGNTMLINGETNYNLQVKKGESIRMYFTNVANTRVFQVAIPWAKMKLVGWDIGKYEREEMIDSFVMAPAERYIVDVYFDTAWKFDILNKNPEFTKKLGSITVSEEEVQTNYKSDFDTLRVNDEVIADIDNFRKYFDASPDKYLDLSVGMKGWMKMNMDWWADGDEIEWSDTMGSMNKMSNSDMTEWKLIDRETGKENMDINWKFKVGDKVKIRIYNDPNSMHPMQHPIHFHGQRFLVVSENGKTPSNMVWKDTAMVKTGEYIDIVMDITNPWVWMSHCHIAEHLSAGMMMSFTVEK